MAWKVPGYKPMARIGAGPTGVVTRAEDQKTGKFVAVKQLSDALYRSPEFLDRYRDEWQALFNLESPHIAQVYEFADEDGSGAIVMELIEGTSLRCVLDSGGALDPESALYILKGTLLGIAAAHRQGVLHRDIKPENILLDGAALPRVTDFGVAARHKRSAPAPGDPRYLAPELWSGGAPTFHTDVYAVIAVLYECLTGEPPRGTDGDYLGLAALPGVYEAAGIRPPGVPDPVGRLIARGLAFHPGDRQDNADELLDELELAALGGYGSGWEGAGQAKLARRLTAGLPLRSVIATPPPPAPRVTDGLFARLVEPFGRFAASRRSTRVLVAAGLVLTLGAAVFAFASGTFDNSAASGTVPSGVHTPVFTPGPTVPPSSSAPGAKPEQPTGLHVTGRSQTAVSLDWNPAHDDTKIAGYIVARDGRRVATTYGPDFTNAGLTAATTYRFSVTAFDPSGNLSPASATVVVTTLARPDIVAPTVPLGLRATGRSTNSVVLVWDPSADNIGVAGYDVFRNGVRVASVAQPYFADNGLTTATAYTYAVSAFDTTNNASHASAPLTVTTLAVPDHTAPSAPAGLVATATSVSTVTLSWSAATDNVGVTGYAVYRDGMQIAIVPDVTFTDEGLNDSTTYSYQVKAIDAAGNRSTASGSAGATTFAPPPPPPPPSSPQPTPTDTPTPTPTDTNTTPPPPPPTVTSVTLSKSAITPPVCTTTISVTVAVSGVAAGGPLTVNLNYSIVSDGIETDLVRQLVFTDDSPQTVALSPDGDGTMNGSATVNDPVSGFGDSTTWNADPTCANPQPTDTTGGTGGPTG